MNRTVNTLAAPACGARCRSRAGPGFPSKPIKIVIPSSQAALRHRGTRHKLQVPGISRPAGRRRETSPARTVRSRRNSSPSPIPTATPCSSARSGGLAQRRVCSKTLRYSPLKDFAPITLAVTTPNVAGDAADLPASSMKELVEFAKNESRQMSYCSSGNGSSTSHRRSLQQGAGITGVHVALQGRRRLPDDIMGKQIDISFQNSAPSQTHKGREDEALRRPPRRAIAVSGRADRRRSRLCGPGRDVMAGRGRARETPRDHRDETERRHGGTMRPPRCASA